MTFNTPVFLFLFLPLCLIIYFAADRRYRNAIALIASLVFFAWGQVTYLPLMLLIILLNYYWGQQIERRRAEPDGGRSVLVWGVGLNLAILVLFKVFASYGIAWLSTGLSITLSENLAAALRANPLPLGLSYIAFQVIAYLIDIYNEVTDSEKNFLNFALYILLFPKIITGPIARYRDLSTQLTDREVTAAGAAQGARRFIVGLAKKALIADPLARIVVPAFALESPSFTTGVAWLVIIGYSLQLYFDFSGYTDMAIGLGQMFGFRFVENFNYPYISRSISEFWRRWHISLSSWFRDYVFYPLEFTRRRADRWRQQLHIFIVFLLTGLWHGLTLNFIIWGAVHGLAMALEMSGFGRWLKKAWRPLSHFYALGVVLIGWVFFRSATPQYAFQFLARLFGSQNGVQALPFSQTQPLPIIENSVWLALVLGVLFSLPLIPTLRKRWEGLTTARPVLSGAAGTLYDVSLLLLLVTSVAATISYGLVATIYGGF